MRSLARKAELACISMLRRWDTARVPTWLCGERPSSVEHPWAQRRDRRETQLGMA
ncbi:Hypothetical protein A7982_01708 [Minicystis rosea]|nr:Hypothetical protein A7982_01708 [Minicystis rosea]